MDLERTTTPDQEIQTLARYLELPPDIFQDRLEHAKGRPRYLPVLLLPDAGLEMAARIKHKFRSFRQSMWSWNPNVTTRWGPGELT